jgi:hypothetical protein
MANKVQRQSMEASVGTRGPAEVERLRAMARLLDSAFQIPGTRSRVGLDALIGLVPFAGDVTSAILSSFIVLRAARLGASRATVVRMMGNIAFDTIVGAIPLLGDLFDAGWKANTRNLALLEAHLQLPGPTARASRRVLLLLGLGLVALLAGIVALGVVAADLVVVQMR